jgi:hypothetical protein
MADDAKKAEKLRKDEQARQEKKKLQSCLTLVRSLYTKEEVIPLLLIWNLLDYYPSLRARASYPIQR